VLLLAITAGIDRIYNKRIGEVVGALRGLEECIYNPNPCLPLHAQLKWAQRERAAQSSIPGRHRDHSSTSPASHSSVHTFWLNQPPNQQHATPPSALDAPPLIPICSAITRRITPRNEPSSEPTPSASLRAPSDNHPLCIIHNGLPNPRNRRPAHTRPRARHPGQGTHAHPLPHTPLPIPPPHPPPCGTPL
jgi:hypothetical protein